MNNTYHWKIPAQLQGSSFDVGTFNLNTAKDGITDMMKKYYITLD